MIFLPSSVNLMLMLFRAMLLLGLLLGSADSSFSQTNPAQPNVLLIIADDLGIDATNGYQSNALMPVTPHLDSLRTAGLTFTNAWSTPVCTSTRGSIMSGKYGVKTGVLGAPGNLNLSDSSVFTRLRTATNSAYAGAVIGKWHISMPLDPSHPQQHGVDHYDGLMEAGVADYYNWTRYENGVQAQETTYATSYLTDAAITWVNGQNSPWFLWLAEMAPHTPFHEPPTNLYTSTPVGTNRRKFIAMIEAMDAEIGRLLDNIPAAVRNNTLVIFVGDNGTAGQVVQYYPSTRAKGTLYQGGIHVPFFVSGPMVTRVNQVEDGLVYVSDICATILEATGNSLPGGIDNSLSFYSLLSNANVPTRPYNYSELTSSDVTGWTIRNAQYKLLDLDSTGQEFYDLVNDPLETTNLIGSLTVALDSIKNDLETEALTIRASWSCRDLIQNGDETGIDCGGSNCAPCAPTATGPGLGGPGAEVTVYPNPNTGRFSVRAVSTGILSVEVFDGQGRQLTSVPGEGRGEIMLDLTGRATGRLFVRTITANRTVVKRCLISDF